MKQLISIGLGWVLLLAFGAMAETPAAITNPSAPLVKQLEACYKRSIGVARTGDLDAYWRTRTAASKSRPPALDSTRLRLLADLLPPLESLQFVRLDTAGKTARALYRWRKEDTAQFTVVVYRMEDGDWKVDDFTVKRGLSTPDSGLLPQARARTGGNSINGASSKSPTDMARVQELMRQQDAGNAATTPQVALGAAKL